MYALENRMWSSTWTLPRSLIIIKSSLVPSSSALGLKESETEKNDNRHEKKKEEKTETSRENLM